MQSVHVPIDGVPVYIEAEERYGEEYTAGGTFEKVESSFERARQTIVNLSAGMARAIREMETAEVPNEFTIEFGVKFKMDGTVVIAALSSEATLTVKMVYQHKV